MTVIVDGTKAKVHWISNNHNNGCLTKEQGILYVTSDNKLGKATAESYAGNTPAEAFKRRYNGMKSAMTSNFIATNIFVFDKSATSDVDQDDSVRLLINNLHSKKRISFRANVGSSQEENSNSEALISYNLETDLPVLTNIIKQYFGKETSYDTKDPIIWWFRQEDDVKEIHAKLLKHNLCLYAAYTGRGKTKIGIEVAVRLLSTGGIVLVTTPITDTKKSFEDNINNFHFGANRNLKITYMDSREFAEHTIKQLEARATAGELIFIVLTVQDARYGDTLAIDDITTIRKKYEALSGHVDLWIRDERHFQYNGEVTSVRLAGIIAKYELDLTATPYNVLDKYTWDQIVSRTLIWGITNKKDTLLPSIRIDAINTPIACISERLANLYTTEEGFDPRKLFVREGDTFILEAELLKLANLFYHSTVSKKKNPLSIANDTELCAVAKKCGMWVLPSGQDGDGASDYIPAAGALLNSGSQNKTFFISSYEVEKLCPKNETIGSYIQSLVDKHGQVVILTCGKFLTGTDISALGHIVLFDKMESIANFEQLLGRMTRVYLGKDRVKMYTLAPGADIGITLGRIAKANVMLAGEASKKAEYDFLDCIPLSEYAIDAKQFNQISPYDILVDVDTWFKEQVRSRLPSRSLEKALYGIDISSWDSIDTSKFKTKIPKKELTETNGAKVKVKVSTNPTTGLLVTKTDRNKIEQIREVIQSVIFESQWVAYSLDNYDYTVVLQNIALEQMFGKDIMDNVRDVISQDADIESMIRGHFLDKQLAYKNLPPEEVYPVIFGNSALKQKIGLVYVPFAFATEIVGKIPTAKYSIRKGVITILVINALNGTFAIAARKRFPNARIICMEYFPYFKDHLERLGFEVMTEEEVKGMGKKFKLVIGNPPYQDSMREDQSNKLWPLFVKAADELTAVTGYTAMITPNNWMQPTADIGKGTGKNAISIFNDIFKQRNLIVANIDSDSIRNTHFKGVGSTFSYFVYQKETYSGGTVLITASGPIIVDIKSISALPKITSAESISISKKMQGAPFNFLDQNHNLNGSETSKMDAHHKHKIYHTNASGGTYWFGANQNVYAKTPKVIISLSGQYTPVVNDMHGFSNMCLAVLCKTTAGAETAQSILTSKLYRFWVEMQKFSGFNPRKLLLALPALPLNKAWTDNTIYKHFKLTAEEIVYVESNVK